MEEEQPIGGGVVHTVPDDMRKALAADEAAREKWNDLTPLARNEWICWVTHVKKAETRAEHIVRLINQLNEGKRRPCCWPGCPHRNPSAAKWFRGAKGRAQRPRK
ncbi:MAG TPA: YdeI/OmpD-associated family protein [Methylomirabilota bacterium]|nr:YdeI/OmpD-associated family protein [Methylomirabilota bacterium]